MVTTAAAKLHIPARDVQLEQLLTALLDLEARRTADSCSRAQQLEPMYVSQTLWGVATMLAAQKRTPPNGKLLHLFQDVAALLTHPQLQLLQAAKPVEVCNTLSAFVIAELPASSLPSPGFAGELLGCLAALRHLRRASARDISRTLWAAAKLGAAVEAADCNALVAMFCSSEMLRSANAQDIANLLWALGTLQQHEAASSSSSRGMQSMDAAQADSLVPVLVQLTQEIGWRLQIDAGSEDVSIS
ncbi:hypothetical protein OEZ85_004950 [Tetradesmus obliquus]|uniref:Telomere length regulation protein conserved domain-containing protein n=1 Tax=Tetradesmus obliquus TaxID=3088 RepID=A0ABY8UGU3_TETOB|nr:hypothetical protein OEZ85_004950 [Tetradesmus obliquus]